MKLDQKDKTILEILKENSKLTTHKIFKKTRIPITTIHNRIKKLEKEGIIKNYTINLNHKKLGKAIESYILVNVIYTLPDGSKIKQEEVAKNIKKLEGVEKVNIMTGGTDIIVNVRVKDIEELNDFVIKKLRNIKGVDKTQTLIVLSNY